MVYYPRTFTDSIIIIVSSFYLYNPRHMHIDHHLTPQSSPPPTQRYYPNQTPVLMFQPPRRHIVQSLHHSYLHDLPREDIESISEHIPHHRTRHNDDVIRHAKIRGGECYEEWWSVYPHRVRFRLLILRFRCRSGRRIGFV